MHALGGRLKLLQLAAHQKASSCLTVGVAILLSKSEITASKYIAFFMNRT
jgi:hypothetical protein